MGLLFFLLLECSWIFRSGKEEGLQHANIANQSSCWYSRELDVPISEKKNDDEEEEGEEMIILFLLFLELNKHNIIKGFC